MSTPENTATPAPRLPTVLLALGLGLFALAMQGLRPLSSDLYWWHITVGEVIATWQRIPDTQLFLFTVDAGEPWVYSSWLGALVLYHLHDFGSAGLALLAHNLCAALSTAIFAFVLARRHRGLLATLLPALTFAVVLFFVSEPEPFALALPAATLALLIALRPRRAWHAALVPLAVAALVNVDFACAALLSLFALGAGLSALLRGQDKSPLARAAAITVALAPLGLLGFAYGPASVPGTFLATALHPPTLLIFSTLLLGSLTAPIIERHLTVADKQPAKALHFALVCALMTLLAAPLQPGVPTRAPVLTTLNPELRTTAPLAGTLSAKLPLRCAEELKKSGRQLRLFHDPAEAGFLLHHTFDARRPSPVLFTDHRGLLSDELAGLPQVLAKDPVARGLFTGLNINAAAVDPDAYPALVEDLGLARNWTNLDENLGLGPACFITR